MRVIFLGSRTNAGNPTNAGTGNQSFVLPFDSFVDERTAVFQADFSAGATAGSITLQGRVSTGVSWTTVATVAFGDATWAKTVVLMPQMRLNVTSVTGGTASGYLGI
jgi:hypothetical protein